MINMKWAAGLDTDRGPDVYDRFSNIGVQYTLISIGRFGVPRLGSIVYTKSWN